MEAARSVRDVPQGILARVLAAVSRRTRKLDHALVCREWRDLGGATTVALRVRDSAGLNARELLDEIPAYSRCLQSLVFGLWCCQDRSMTYATLTNICQACTRLEQIDLLEVYMLTDLEEASDGEEDRDEQEEDQERVGQEAGAAAALNADPAEAGGGERAEGSPREGPSETGPGPGATTTAEPPHQQFPSVTSVKVDYTGRGCRGLKAWLSSLPGLRKLWLGYPRGLSQLVPCFKGLHVLRLVEGSGIQIPPSISLLGDLHSLLIRVESLGPLPTELGSLRSLRRLKLEVEESDGDLPGSLSGLRSLVLLHLRVFNGMHALPEGLGFLRQLTSLRVAVDGLQSLPASITRLPKLKDLEVSGEGFQDGIPDLRRSSRSLTSLTVECFEQVPSNLPLLTRLKTLHLLGSFSELPNMSSLQALESIDLGSSSLRSFFPQHGSFPRLKSLSVAHCDSLQPLSLEPWYLPSLERLHLKLLRADTLPAPLCSCSRLTDLSLFGGELETFPQDILLLPSLRMVELTGLKVEPLPRDVPLNASCLEQLHAPCRLLGLLRLQALEEEPRVQQIRAHCLNSENGCPKTTEVPLWMAQLTSLTTVDVASCGCVLHCPGELLLLPMLGDSSREALTQLLSTLSSKESLEQGRPLPSSLESLKSLRTLEVSQHAGSALPELSPLSLLRSLEIRKCNILLELPPSLGQLHSLTALEVQDCAALGGLPHSLGGLPQLISLRLACCPALEALPVLGTLEHLQVLVLEGLPSLASPPELEGLDRLTQLCLSGCARLSSLPESLSTLESLRILVLGSGSPPVRASLVPASLEELVIDSEATAALAVSGKVFPTLMRLKILQGVPSLQGACFPAVTRLEVLACPDLGSLWEQASDVTTLEEIVVKEASPPWGDLSALGSLRALRVLTIVGGQGAGNRLPG